MIGPIPKPNPCPRTKSQRLLTRKAVTIAIHLLAGGGTTLTATDTQETYGTGQVVNSGKIIGVWRREPLGALNVTGAGDAPYIDAVAQDIVRRFRDFTGDAVQWEMLLRSIVRDFYRTNIRPFVGRVESESVPIASLLVSSRHLGTSGLWATHDALVTESIPFGCVGIGRPVAESLLTRFMPMYPTLDAIAVLAAYVIYRVKASVEGCGLNTEIRFIFRDRVGIVPSETIDGWESLFRRYDRLVDCRSEFVSAQAAAGVRVLPLDGASVGGVGIDVATEFAAR